MNVTHRKRQQFYALPSSDWQMLAEPPFSLLQNLSDVDDAIDCNAEIADAILECGLRAFKLPMQPGIGHFQNWQDCAKAADLDKAHSTIRQFYRDWSAEGGQERKYCYEYILDQLRVALHDWRAPADQASRPKVLVPGAGLGRLAYEICRAGYEVEGNEISYHQLLASSWVLNHAGATSRALYPFATQFTNLRSRKQQLRKVMIPDIHPVEDLKQASTNGEMKMTAADFVVLYSGKGYQGRFDAVTTVFFIDTAPNFIRYIDTMKNCLRCDGLWINVGPLLWHSDDVCDVEADKGEDKAAREKDDRRDAGIREPGSFELTEEEVIWLLQKRGFQVGQQQTFSDGVGYIQDPDSMLQNKYRVCCWVAKKAV